MTRRFGIVLALLGVVLCSACEAIDNLNPFHVVDDGGADLAGAENADLSGAVDMEVARDLVVPPDLAPQCVATLAGVGASDFAIRFRITTKAMAYSTVLYQRSTCDSTKDLWDIEINSDGGIRPAGPDGLLTIFLNHAGTPYSAVATTIPVNDGLPHDIVIQRRAGVLATTTDGVPSGGGAAAQSLGALSPLGVATGSPCAPPNGGSQPLVGTLTNVCLSEP